ncbi:MAG: NAD-dependent epimerase/dehydratase family protein [Gammaproteobacteria bacterium]
MSDSSTTLLVGAGYVGTALARELARRHVACEAVVTSKASAERLHTAGIPCRRIDLDSGTAFDLPSVTQIVYLVPPKRSIETDIRLKLFLQRLPASVKALLYVSTSGVYGDQNGKLIDESTLPSPHSARARRRVDAENQIQRYCNTHKINWIIARVPGIYGPGRMPLKSLKEGRPIIRESESNPGNRIHRDDLARSLADLLEHAKNGRLGDNRTIGEVFNAGDNNHMNGSRFTLEVARLANLKAPPQISRAEMKAAASSVRWSFLAESRRLNSDKLHGLLSQPMQYLNPLDGIRASLEEAEDPAA